MIRTCCSLSRCGSFLICKTGVIKWGWNEILSDSSWHCPWLTGKSTKVGNSVSPPWPSSAQLCCRTYCSGSCWRRAIQHRLFLTQERRLRIWASRPFQFRTPSPSHFKNHFTLLVPWIIQAVQYLTGCPSSLSQTQAKVVKLWPLSAPSFFDSTDLCW